VSKNARALTSNHLLFRIEFYSKLRWLNTSVKTAIKEARSVEVFFVLVDVENLQQVAIVFLAFLSLFIFLVEVSSPSPTLSIFLATRYRWKRSS